MISIAAVYMMYESWSMTLFSDTFYVQGSNWEIQKDL